jgi:hypothetical protein
MWADDDDYDTLTIPVSLPDPRRSITLSAILEPEDLVFPAPTHHRNPSSNSTLTPLKSFIDLHTEDDISAWSWRSFVEVSAF